MRTILLQIQRDDALKHQQELGHLNGNCQHEINHPPITEHDRPRRWSELIYWSCIGACVAWLVIWMVCK